MRVCWMLVILLGCRLSRTTLSHPNCKCDEPLKFHSVPANGKLFVPCPNISHFEEVTINLYRDQNVIYNHSCHSGVCKQTYNRSDVKLDTNELNQFVGLTISGDAVRNLTTYSCMGTVTYPPPLQNIFGQRIVALKEGHNCTRSEDNDIRQNVKETIERGERFLWIWITAVVLLSTYSLIVTILALVIWFKLNTTDTQSDYMNTKPRVPRERRKKGGIQNPIPRYV